MEQAEKIEQEFVSLMTGQVQGQTTEKIRRDSEDRNERRKFSSPSKLALVWKRYLYVLYILYKYRLQGLKDISRFPHFYLSFFYLLLSIGWRV